jgi:hypothetical protein
MVISYAVGIYRGVSRSFRVYYDSSGILQKRKEKKKKERESV